MTVDWPIDILTPRDIVIVPRNLTRPKQEATNGMRRSIGLSGTALLVSLIDVPITSRAKVREMRKLLFLMEQDTALVRIPLPDRYGVAGRFNAAASGDVTGTLSAAASINQRTISVTQSPILPEGVFIGIDDFVYGVGTSTNAGTGVNALWISPPLRRAAAAGTVVSFDPSVVAVCTSDLPGNEPLMNGDFGFYTFEFEEDLTRLASW